MTTIILNELQLRRIIETLVENEEGVGGERKKRKRIRIHKSMTGQEIPWNDEKVLNWGFNFFKPIFDKQNKDVNNVSYKELYYIAKRYYDGLVEFNDSGMQSGGSDYGPSVGQEIFIRRLLSVLEIHFGLGSESGPVDAFWRQKKGQNYEPEATEQEPENNFGKDIDFKWGDLRKFKD